MRFIHTADWHLGRLFYNVSLTGEQGKIIFDELLPLVKDARIEAVVLAGDVYDRGVPPVEAVELFNTFLAKLSELHVPLLFVAGNHDSALRLDFGRSLFKKAGVYAAGRYVRGEAPVALEDKYGKVYFSLLPYVEPLEVRRDFGLEEKLDFNKANELIVQDARALIPKGARSVAIAHAFLAGAVAGGSERTLSVGGASWVSPAVYQGFSYTALGHLHGPQRAGAEHIRYSGSLMKYSFDECHQKKGVNIVELDAKGKARTEFVALSAPRDVRRIEGSFEELLNNREKYPRSEDYLEAELSDNVTIVNAAQRLRAVFPNLLSIRTNIVAGAASHIASKEMLKRSEEELFAGFYLSTAGVELSEEQRAFARACIRELHEEEREAK